MGNNMQNFDWGTAAAVGSTAFSQIGLTYGKDFLGKGQQQYLQSFSMLKYYFNVNNSYVVNKLKLLLFPVSHKFWKRRILRQAEGEVYLPPRDDINAPDLYIPTMAFVSYVLIIGFLHGTTYNFTPAVLGLTASHALAIWLLELLFIKFVFYLLNSFTVPVLDVVSYCGYKYVGIVLTLLGGFIFGHLAYYIIMATTCLFTAIFMVKTLKSSFPEAPTSGFGDNSVPNKRNYFLLSIGVLQLPLGYYLSYDLTRM